MVPGTGTANHSASRGATGGGILGRDARLPAAVERDTVRRGQRGLGHAGERQRQASPSAFTVPPRRAWPTSAPVARCRTARRARR
jgi:hypothetical protein